MVSLALNPLAVYGAICLFMLGSAFGIPIPEEVILVSAGFVGHAALFPESPHPPGASVVNIHILAVVSFCAVLGADYLIYSIGKKFGPRLFEKKWFQRMVPPDRVGKVQRWMQKYGYWPVIVFRFTPGVRFPGHLVCGASGLSPWKFIGVDTVAALVSVPTQIYFVGFYGKEILSTFKTFKMYLFAALAIALLIFAIRKLKEARAQS